MALLPLFALIAIAGIGISPLVGGFNFSMEALTPKLSKMNPLEGLKKIFSVQSLVELILITDD